MKSTSQLIAIFCVMSAFALSGSAQPDQGDWELSLSGALSIVDPDDGSSSEVLIISGEASYYYTPNWEVGVSPTVFVSFDDDITSVILDLIGNYNFVSDSPWVPYIGAGGGFGYVEVDDDDDFDTLLGGQAGIKYFFEDNNNFFAEYRYRHVFDADFDSHEVLVGVSILFGGS